MKGSSLFGDIGTNLIAAAIVAIAAWAWARRWIFRHLRQLPKWISTQTSWRKTSAQLTLEQRALLTKLMDDQSLVGIHAGEFGKTQSIAESEEYNRRRENIHTKPRMHMTRWPCRILTKHGIAGDRVKLSLTAINALMGAQATIMGDDPFPKRQIPGGGTRKIINYRHTKCAALIQLECMGQTPQTRLVIDRMISRELTWQNPDGGWPDCSTFSETSDIFSSAYALQILCLRLKMSDSECLDYSSISPIISRTKDYLKKEWKSNKWAFGRFSSYEILPQLFPEISPILRELDQAFYNLLIESITRMISDHGDIMPKIYDQMDQSVTPFRQKIRLLYCLSNCERLTAGQRECATTLIAEAPMQYASSVEVSMLLDLALTSD